jgi:hypothetical protein
MTELGILRAGMPALGQHRSTQRRIPTTPDDEAALTADIIELARKYGRYGYRRITALLRRAAAVGSRYGDILPAEGHLFDLGRHMAEVLSASKGI